MRKGEKGHELKRLMPSHAPSWFVGLHSLQETYEAKRNEFLGELQKKEEEMRQMFVMRVKEKEAELKEAEKEVRLCLSSRRPKLEAAFLLVLCNSWDFTLAQVWVLFLFCQMLEVILLI